MKKLLMVSLCVMLCGCALAESTQKRRESQDAYLACVETGKPCSKELAAYLVWQNDYERRMNSLAQVGNSPQRTATHCQRDMMGNYNCY